MPPKHPFYSPALHFNLRRLNLPNQIRKFFEFPIRLIPSDACLNEEK